VTATYDSLDRVVEQYNGSGYTQILHSPVGKTALMSGSTLTKAFVNLPGGATAIYNSSGLAYYRHSDHLRSSRMASTQARGLYSSTAYAPFGEPYEISGTVDASFTDQNQDTVSSLYDFTFRKHSHSQGRWISPDPAGVDAVDPANPQTWNRYSYVGNSPLNFVDPSGLQQKGPGGGGCNSDVMNCSGGAGTGDSGSGGGDGGFVLVTVSGGYFVNTGKWDDPKLLWIDFNVSYTSISPGGGGDTSTGTNGGGGAANNGPTGSNSSPCSVAVSCDTSIAPHCGITVGQGNGSYTQYNGEPSTSSVAQISNPFSNQPKLIVNTVTTSIPIAPVPGSNVVFNAPVSCSTAGCIQTVTSVFNSSQYTYSPLFLNSNTYASDTTKACGLSVNYPWNAVGAQ